MSAGRPWLGMKSRSQAGSASCWLMVGGRKPRIDRERGRDDAGRAARALRMADHRLHRRSREPIGVRAEHLTHRPGFDRVVQHRRRAVIADVPDRFEWAARSLDRQRDRAHDLLAVRRHLHAVIRVAGRAIAVHRGVDPGAARARARSSRSSTTIQAPSPSTNPSRPLSNGRDASPGARCTPSTPPACARSRRSCRASRTRRCRPRAAPRPRPTG